MNREIKIRAWDGGKMILPQDKAYYQHYMSFCGFIVRSSHEGMACLGGGDVWNRPEVEALMQYTGIKDKNGAEIYEGDALNIHVDGESFYAGVVTWLGEYDHLGFGLVIGDGVDELNASWSGSYEVVGNIYENPEFVKPYLNLSDQ